MPVWTKSPGFPVDKSVCICKNIELNICLLEKSRYYTVEKSVYRHKNIEVVHENKT